MHHSYYLRSQNRGWTDLPPEHHLITNDHVKLITNTTTPPIYSGAKKYSPRGHCIFLQQCIIIIIIILCGWRKTEYQLFMNGLQQEKEKQCWPQVKWKLELWKLWKMVHFTGQWIWFIDKIYLILTCLWVHFKMGEPPPISSYFFWTSGVLLLAIRGPRVLKGKVMHISYIQ